MAKFNVVGLDDVQEAMLRQDAIVEEAVPEMLKAGGAVMQKAQQEEIKTRFNSRRSTGALLASIKVSAVKEIDGGKRVKSTERKDKHGVRNAKKASSLITGAFKYAARRGSPAANEKAADDVVSEMRRVWEEKQKKNVDSLLKAELEKLGVPVERLNTAGRRLALSSISLSWGATRSFQTMKRARRNSRIKYTSIQKRITSTFFNA